MVRGGRTIRGASLTPTPNARLKLHARVQQRDTHIYEQIKYLQLLTTNHPAVRVYDRIARRRKFTGVSLVLRGSCVA